MSGPAISIASACVHACVTLLVDVCGMEWDGTEWAPRTSGFYKMGYFGLWDRIGSRPGCVVIDRCMQDGVMCLFWADNSGSFLRDGLSL